MNDIFFLFVFSPGRFCVSHFSFFFSENVFIDKKKSSGELEQALVYISSISKTQGENGRTSLGSALRGSSGFPPPHFLLQRKENENEKEQKKEIETKKTG